MLIFTNENADQDVASPQQLIAKAELQHLLTLLRQDGYTVVGPQVSAGAIVYDELTSIEALPKGISDSQQAGKYRLLEGQHENYFQFNAGPHAWKQFLFPSRQQIGTATLGEDGWSFETPEESPPKYAFLGARACDLAAIKIQDRIFMEGPFVNPFYAARRQAALIIAVQCTVAATTCFCTSMQTGPRCDSVFDLALTELETDFLVEVGTTRGAAFLEQLDSRPANQTALETAAALQARAEAQITKQLDTKDIHSLLLDHLNHPRWDQVAERCLSCTNCTMVCPTCFCATVEEVASLAGDQVDRVQRWDSCFNFDFSYTAGGVVRDDRRSRYRQWLTHKLATWHDQFDSSGCVGCGRCITWCPVGIDLTEEVAALRAEPDGSRSLTLATPSESQSCKIT
ncbi:4Fe-4S dicluster domain-containing protein [Planctomycetaceae bacterium SH139]